MKCGLAAFIQPHSCRPRHDSGSALPVSTDTKLGRDELFCPLRMAVSSPCTCRVAALQLQVPASCLFSCTALARLLPSVSWMQGPTPRLLGRRRRAGPWCFIGPSAGRACTCVRPGHGHGPRPALACARLAMASWLKAQPAAAAAVSCACWGVGACRRPRPMATAACRPATELRLALALRHVRVLYPCAWVSSLDRTCL